MTVIGAVPCQRQRPERSFPITQVLLASASTNTHGSKTHACTQPTPRVLLQYLKWKVLRSKTRVGCLLFVIARTLDTNSFLFRVWLNTCSCIQQIQPTFPESCGTMYNVHANALLIIQDSKSSDSRMCTLFAAISQVYYANLNTTFLILIKK